MKRSADPLEPAAPPSFLTPEGGDDESRPRTELRRRIARGTIINAAFNVGLNGLGLIKGFVAAAFLTTTDYGVWGLLFIVIATLGWLKQVGVGDKYVQQTERDQELAFQKAFTLELIVTGAFTAALFAIVPALALITDQPELVLPGIGIALSVPAASLQAPLWIFYRRMNFARQRTLQAVDPIVAALVTIALAAVGAGYWSLVVGLLAGSWCGALVAVKASPYRLALRYESGTFREYRDFSWPLFIGAAASLVLPQGSMLLGEHAVGLAGVGAIALAVTVAQFAERVDQIITSTIYPAICEVKDRTDLLLESFVKSNRLALMWGVPFGVGLALFTSDLVEFGIGDRWRPAVQLIQVMGLIAAADQLGFNWDAYFRARADTRPIAIVGIVNMIVFLAVTVPLLYSNGLDGFAVGMAVVTAVSILMRTYFLTRLFSAFTMARQAVRAIAPVVPAVGVVLALRMLESGSREPLLAVVELGAFLLVAAVATLVLERKLLREVASYLRSAPAAGPATA
jgi:O-antigen/teichoic acid export membrane protein